jgi:hypothetical protein
MCGCEHHWQSSALCTCSCPEHDGQRRQQRLVALGFIEESWGGEWSAEVPGGTFRFKVRLKTHEPFEDEPLSEPRWSVTLPHQCDAWEIVSGLSPEDALDTMRRFQEEARAAFFLLARATGQDT